MAFRFLMLAICILAALIIATQVIWPAVVNRPLFPIFRKESALQRARRLRQEADDRRDAAKAEAEAVRLETEAQSIRDSAFEDALNRHNREKESTK